MCVFCFASHQFFRQTSGTVSDSLFDFILEASSLSYRNRVKVAWSVARKVERSSVRPMLVWPLTPPWHCKGKAASLRWTGTLRGIYWLLCDWIEPELILNWINTIHIIHLCPSQPDESHCKLMDTCSMCWVPKGLLWMRGRTLWGECHSRDLWAIYNKAAVSI